MSEEETVEVEETVEPTPGERLQEVLDKRAEEPQELPGTDTVEEVAKTEEVEETTYEEPTPAPSAPTTAMAELARVQGVPDVMIASARDDAQLQEYIGMVATPAKQQPAEEDPYKLELSEEHFDSDDPVRKAFEKNNTHYDAEIKEMKELMGQLVDITQKTQSHQQFTEQKSHANEQRQFDEALSMMEVGALGNGEVTQEQGALRGLIFDSAYRKLREKNPSQSVSDAAQEAARAILPGLTDNQQAAAMKQTLASQSKRRLGGGPTKAAIEPPKPIEMRMQELVDRLSK